MVDNHFVPGDETKGFDLVPFLLTLNIGHLFWNLATF